MRVLLINSPIRLHAKPNNIPYGLAQVAAVLRGRGHEVTIFDANALRPGERELKQTLELAGWDAVGLSGLITTYQWQKRVIKLLKQINPKAPVVTGGGLATSVPELVFDTMPVDGLVMGEGEYAAVELFESLEKGAPALELPGVWWRENGVVHRGQKSNNTHELDDLPFPAWDLLPMDLYLENPVWGASARNSSGFPAEVKVFRSMNVISSRGCPRGCRYCFHLFGRGNYRFRSAGHVMAELEYLVKNYGVDFIGFVDDNMMAHQGRMEQFCGLMIERGLPIKWGCHGRVTEADPSLPALMARAGCVWIGYGIESGSPRILKAMNKNATIDQAAKAILATRAAGIFANTTFIFGYPGEDETTVAETIKFKQSLELDCGSFFATPYPGTPLFEQVRPKLPPLPEYVTRLGDATEFVVNLTDMADDTFFALKKAMDEC